MSELRADTITSATDNTDLEVQARGTGVPNLESGFKVGGTAGLPVSELRAGTDGELITWDASGNPTTVAVGTSAQVLTSNGAGAAPTFQDASAGAWEVIEVVTCSTDASIQIGEGNIDADYDYHIQASQVYFSANVGARYPLLQFGTGGGPTYQTASYRNDVRIFANNVTLGESDGITSGVSIAAPGTYQLGAGSTRPMFSEMLIMNPAANAETMVMTQTTGIDGSTQIHQVIAVGWRDVSEVITGFQFITDSTQTFDGGSFILRRRKRTV